MKSRRPPLVLLLGGAGALLFMLWLVAVSLRRPAPPTWPVTSPHPAPAGDSLVSNRIVTVDARSHDAWVLFDLSRSTVVGSGALPPDDSGWDLAVRRHDIVVNGGDGFAGSGAALALPGTPFAAVETAPAADSDRRYVVTEVTPGQDTVHATLSEWYEYDFFSHLLSPRDITYVLRTADGRWAKLRVLGYYCPGPEPGCLTLRYSYQGNGTRRLVAGGDAADPGDGDAADPAGGDAADPGAATDPEGRESVR